MLREIETRIDFLVGFERLPHCYWQTTSRRVWNASYGEWIASQSSLMSVSTGKVMLLKARFNLASALLLALSRFLFSESEMILFPASGVSSKFVQIYLLTFLQNTARLTSNEENSISLIVYCFIFNVNRENICYNRELHCTLPYEVP